MLHGCSQSARGFAAGTAMNDVADRNGFVVAYLVQSLRTLNRCWRWYVPGQATRDGRESAELVGIVDHIAGTVPIDRSRVGVGGLSAGGAIATALAVGYPEVFSCLASHSGLPYGVAQGMAGALRAMRRAPVPRTVTGTHRVLAGRSYTDPSGPAASELIADFCLRTWSRS